VVKIIHHFKTIVTRAHVGFHDLMMTYRWEHKTELEDIFFNNAAPMYVVSFLISFGFT
jgi:hypothetical protein